MKHSRLTLLLSVVAVLGCSADGRLSVADSPSTHPQMEFNPDHNRGRGGFTRTGWTSSGALLPHQFALVTAPHPVRYGTHSERFEIRPDDHDGMAGETEANRSELLQRPHRDNSRIGTDAWFGWSFYQDDLPILDHTFGWFPMFGQWKTDLSAAPVIAIAPAHDGGPDGGAHMGVRLEDLAEGQSRAWDKANQFGTPCRLFFL